MNEPVLKLVDGRTPVEQRCSLDDESLRLDAELLALELGIDDDEVIGESDDPNRLSWGEIQSTTWQLYDEGLEAATRRGVGERFARETLESLRFGFCILDTILDFYEIDGQRASHIKAAFWAAFINSDTAKDVLPKWLIEKSEKGTEDWTSNDTKLMGIHPYLGYLIVKDRGLCRLISRPIAEHHGKQVFNNEFRTNPDMSNDEEIVCAALRIGDTSWAANMRRNTKYVNQQPQQRWVDIARNIAYVFNHYDPEDDVRRQALIDCVRSKVFEFFPPPAEYYQHVSENESVAA